MYVQSNGTSTSGSRMANPHAFGQRQPPLSVTIKSILERYPDGQIFKVIKLAILRPSSSEPLRMRPPARHVAKHGLMSDGDNDKLCGLEPMVA